MMMIPIKFVLYDKVIKGENPVEKFDSFIWAGRNNQPIKCKLWQSMKVENQLEKF
jgi:hypothetical protein